MWVLKLLLVPVFLYFAILAAIFFFQTAILFPARHAGGSVALPTGSERLFVDTPDGERLHGVRIPPVGKGGDGRLILGFGGNGWNAEAAALYLHGLFPGAQVVTFHYRGYRPSGGMPSAEALLADAPLIHDWTAKRFGADGIVAVGFSIGTGVATRLAARRELAGLILVTPFDSLEKVAAGHYRWLPVGLLLRHRMRPAEDLHGSSLPVALIVAERDTLIPPRRAQALAAQIPNLVLEASIPNAGHNDIYDNPVLRSVMRDALAKIEASRAPG